MHAQTAVDLSFVADSDSRFFDLLSGSFAQIVPEPPEPIEGSHEDGYFSVTETGYPLPYNSRTFDLETFDPVEFTPVGDGTPDAFPNERHFQSAYSITYDESQVAGVGFETAPLISADFDFYSDFGFGDLLGVVGYVTRSEAPTGVVQLINGQVTGFEGTVELTFVYDFTQWGYLAETDFSGALTFDGRRWTLLVDDMHDPPEFNLDNALRVIWDGHGYLDGLYETGLPGDYNNDGAVDAADYTVWRDSLGLREGALPNDVDGGDITVAQYLTWRDNYGALLPADSGVQAAFGVPEPLAGGLALAAVAAASVLPRWSGRER